MTANQLEELAVQILRRVADLQEEVRELARLTGEIVLELQRQRRERC